MSIDRRIARHIIGVGYDRLPPNAIISAKQSLLDAVGVTLAASSLGESSAAFAEIARQAANDHGASVIGFGFKAAPAVAAFANGAMAHSLDYEDTFDAALVHPNAAVVPAALAVAETNAGIGGKKLIAAIAIGADLTCRLGLAIDGHEKRGFGVRFLCGALGATAATGKLLGLTEDQLIEAFALALFQASFPSETMSYAPSHMRAVREAFPAQAAVNAAQLAKRGLRAFDQPFEGKHGFFGLYTDGFDETALMRDLGEMFGGAEVSFKPWPSCRGTHAYIEATLALMSEHAIGADAVERVDTVVSPFFRALSEPPKRKRRPQTAIDAKFSIPYTVAVALQDRGVGLNAFQPDRLNDPDLHRLADRVEHTIEESWSTREATRGTLHLRLHDSRAFSRSILTPLGHPDNPMTEAAMRRKFSECAAYARVPLAPGQADRIADRIERLEHMTDVGGLLVA